MTDAKKFVPKVLVFSHNPISYTTGNGKTLAAFFSEWPSSHVAQIYTNNFDVDFSLCNNYYHINEKKLIQTFVTKNYYGENISNNHNDVDVLSQQMSFFTRWVIKFFHTSIGLAIREYVWKRDFINNAEFVSWIEDFCPDVLFFTLGENIQEYKFILKLHYKYNLPIVLYASDDYLSKQKGNPIYVLQRNRLRKSYFCLAQSSSLLIAIGDAMALKFQKEYHYPKNIIVAMNSCDIDISNIDNMVISEFPNKLLYTGNLGLGRWNVLATFAQLLPYASDQYYMSIYSTFSVSKAIQNKLEQAGCAKFCGAVDHGQLNELRRKTDILVLVESFDKKYKELLSTAVSTKVPEYLASGKIILAIGPAYSASISYIKDHNAGYCITNLSKCEILGVLDKISHDPQKEKIQKIDNALELAISRHNKKRNSKLIMQSIRDTLKGNEHEAQ